MFNTLIGAIINVGLNYLLIPHYGIWGSALATVVAYSFAGFLGYGFFRKTRTPFFMILRSFNIFKAYKVLRNA
jgi:Na+-driven multidrug efflux pump